MTSLSKRLVDSPWFQRSVIVAIICAGVLAGLETSPSIIARHGGWLRILDLTVLGIFVLEMALKIAAHGRRPFDYFRQGWNVFDFAIVAICLLPVDGMFASVLRLARVLRLLRLVSALPKLQLLVGALLHSLSAMGYVTLLLTLILYIYAVTGVHLFGARAPAEFGTLGLALMTLFQMITLDNWSELYHAARAASPAAAVVYFVSFILLGTMIMLNLFIGVVMNSMNEMQRELEGSPASPLIASPDLAERLAAIESHLACLRQTATRPTGVQAD